MFGLQVRTKGAQKRNVTIYMNVIFGLAVWVHSMQVNKVKKSIIYLYDLNKI